MENLSDHMSDSLKEERYGLPEQEVLQKEIKERVREEIYKLDDKLRLPLLMFYTGNLSHQEIGAILKIPKGTVKSRLFKARKILSKEMEDLKYEN